MLLFAVGDRGEGRRSGRGATDGADEVDTIIKGGKQRGKQSQEFRLSIPAPFRFAARIFRLRFPGYKIWHRDDFGTRERAARLQGGTRRANCHSFHWKSQNTGQSSQPTLSQSI